VILNADMLTGSLPEKLVSFLSNREVVVSGMRLHCIQRRPSLLHSGPWVEGSNWDYDSLQAELLGAGVYKEPWVNLLVSPYSVDEVSVFWTPSSGTGKTRSIENRLDELLRQEDATEVDTIVIHEQSSALSLIEDMQIKFSSGDGGRAVHFSFSCMPERNAGTIPWLESINRFFSSLLLLGSAHELISGSSFHLVGRRWKFFVELPARPGVSGEEWLRHNIPTISFCGSLRAPLNEFIVDVETRRVCTYLRALSDGTINRKFEAAAHGRQIIFILDWSGSMTGAPLNAAIENALRLFDSHVHIGDRFGVTMFDHRVYVAIPVQEIGSDQQKQVVRDTLNQLRTGHGGGTNLYGALHQTLISAHGASGIGDTWAVCLTDGASCTSSEPQLRDYLGQTADNVRIIVVGVNLNGRLEERMQLLCGKYRGCESGFFVPSGGTLADLNAAFATVASRIPVSQTFELFDGVLTDDECRGFLRRYTSSFLDADDKLLLNFWIRFLYRRVKVFDMNTDFNENVEYESLGSTLMETMLAEVQRLLAENQSREWAKENHAQLIYDFDDPNEPKFRLICTSPDELSEGLRRQYEALDLPGFKIPTNGELQNRGTLDRYISQALSVPLQKTSAGEERLGCIDEAGFILTLDFTIKLLSMHERVACRLPCVIEGETGVSKTALTRMYSILRNSSIRSTAVDRTQKAITDLETRIQAEGFELQPGKTALDRLCNTLEHASQNSIGDETAVAGALHRFLLEEQRRRTGIFQSIPSELNNDGESRSSTVRSLLDWFASAILEPTFFDINVDSSLTEKDIMAKFEDIRRVADKLLHADALVVVFLDGEYFALCRRWCS